MHTDLRKAKEKEKGPTSTPFLFIASLSPLFSVKKPRHHGTSNISNVSLINSNLTCGFESSLCFTFSCASRDIYSPATLKEASLDSPTFRGTILHYAEQVDLIDKWLDGFIKASTKLVNEVLGRCRALLHEFCAVPLLTRLALPQDSKIL
jgi:hypothetical protein